MNKKYFLILLVAGVWSSSTSLLLAEENEDTGVVITPPATGQIEEYRDHGRVYMIKVTPAKGKPYYLVDADGDGEFDTRRSDLDPNLKIPSWVILRW